MTETPSIINERAQLTALRDETLQFLSAVAEHNKPAVNIGVAANGEEVEYLDYTGNSAAPSLTNALSDASEELARRIRQQMVRVSGLAKGAALLGEEDLRDLSHLTKTMAAAVRFRRYSYQDLYVHHDEDRVLGVTPAGQSESEKVSLEQAQRLFSEAYRRVMASTDLISPNERSQSAPAEKETSSYKPDTAFIMMHIDKSIPDLDDTLDTMKQVFKRFGIAARRADEIEHDDAITDRVIQEIESAEFLVADLTGERPSVYYEVGYAHAIKKRVILYHKKGSPIHFDLAHRQCPEYGGQKELRSLLHKRLVAMTGKQIPEES